jgi:hypothetical protein
VAGWVGGDLFGGAGGYDLAAAAAALGAHVDDPVGGFDDVEIVLDDQQGAAAFDELAEGAEELGDVVEVEAGGGLVEDVNNRCVKRRVVEDTALPSSQRLLR